MMIAIFHIKPLLGIKRPNVIGFNRLINGILQSITVEWRGDGGDRSGMLEFGGADLLVWECGAPTSPTSIHDLILLDCTAVPVCLHKFLYHL